jgi:uncharacterized protein YkwD
MRAMSLAASRSGGARVFLVAAFAALMALSVGPISNPEPAQAGTADTMEASLLSWINAARDKQKLPPLRLRASLVDLAGDRARKLAETAELRHPACLACKLRKRSISFSTCGEVIAYTTWPWGSQAAESIFNGWKRSTSHWSMLMSAKYTSIGIGVAYRGSNKSTWAAGVLTG